LLDVVTNLSAETQKADPEHRGVNFILSSVANEEMGNEVDNIRVQIPLLTNIAVLDALDVIVKATQSKIKYSIEDYAVVFSLASPDNLYTRVFKVDTNMFQSVTNTAERDKTVRIEKYGGGLEWMTVTNASAVGDPMRTFFQAHDVFMAPPKTCYFSHGKGLLMVRATLTDLEIIEKALAAAQSGKDKIPFPGDVSQFGRLIRSNQLALTVTAQNPNGQFEYDKATGVATADKGVVVQYGDIILKAKKVTVNQEKGQMLAEGNVQLQGAGDKFSGDHLNYDFKHQHILESAPPVTRPPVNAAVSLEKAAPDAHVEAAIDDAVRNQELNILMRKHLASAKEARNQRDLETAQEYFALALVISNKLGGVIGPETRQLLTELAALPLKPDAKLTLSNLVDLYRERGELKQQIAEVSAKYTQQHPVLKNLSRKLDELEQTIAATEAEFQPQVEQLVKEGRALYEEARFDEATSKLEEALTLSPKNKSAPYYLMLIREAKIARASKDLQTKMFNIHQPTFEKNLKGLRKISNGVTALNLNDSLAMFRAMLADLGAKMDPPKAMFFNDRTGQLMVRAAKEDFDIIEKTLQMLNQAPPQLTIEARFCEVVIGDGEVPDYAKLLDVALTNAAAPSNLRKEHQAAFANATSPLYGTGAGMLDDTNAAAATLSGILTAAQYKEVLRRLEKQKGVDLLSLPKVTTLSGRQAQIKVVDIKYIVTGMATSPATNLPGAKGKPGEPVPITEPFELGPVLDVVPSVLADGQSIQMTVIPSVMEFLGYEGASEKRAPMSRVDSAPQPRFRKRLVVSSATVRDGHTLVLAGGICRDEIKVEKGWVRSGSVVDTKGVARSTGGQRKALLVFVTPTLIDAAGNRVHSEEELMKRDPR
jgi:type II secretory pathway component GspD/PulD (secretin)